MRKKAPKHKPKSANTLLKTSKKAQVELTEQQLGKVSGGLGKLHFGGDTETGSGGGFAKAQTSRSARSQARDRRLLLACPCTYSRNARLIRV